MRIKNLIFSFAIVLAGLFTCCTPKSVGIESLSIYPTSLELVKGESEQLKATVLPENAEGYTLTWSSSDSKIATVDNSGNVTAVETGVAVITLSSGTHSTTAQVTVIGKEVEGIVLDKTTLSLTEGEESQLTATVTPSDAENVSVSWKSSDESIVSVDQTGKVGAISAGKATVIATAGDKSATCEVTVSGIPVESVTLDITEAELKAGETLQLTATVLPEDAADRSVVWSSGDEAVATVDDNGLVTAVAAGAVTVSATAGGIEAECEITVLSAPAVGDFFYSDGSWSANLDESKKVIGVIFWTGDPGAKDELLRKDHPECTNGLVVSLDGEKAATWQKNYAAYGKTVSDWLVQNTEYNSINTNTGVGDNLNDIVGYHNTKAIEAFNAAPENSEWPVDIATDIAAYREQVPAPETTSDWYCPSPKELSLLCTGTVWPKGDGKPGNIWDGGSMGGGWTSDWTANRDFLNTKLEQIDGALILEGAENPVTYWGSSEIGPHGVHCFFSFATVSSSKKETQYNTNFRVRYVLAF